MMKKEQSGSILRLVELSMLTAIVVVLQVMGVAIKIPALGTSISLVLIPIALGAMLLGPFSGAFLGFVFGMVVFIVGGVMAADPFTAMLFAAHPFLTFLTCTVKSTVAGLAAGFLYRALLGRFKSPLPATFAAAGIVPILNTGIFILGCLTMKSAVTDISLQFGFTQGFFYFVIIGCAGINFLFEFGLNLILSPALARIALAVRKSRSAGKRDRL